MTETLVTVSLPAEKLFVHLPDMDVECLICERTAPTRVKILHTPNCPIAKALGQKQEEPA